MSDSQPMEQHFDPERCPTTGTAHDWQPEGFAFDDTCGGLEPRDRCTRCSGVRWVTHGNISYRA